MQMIFDYSALCHICETIGKYLNCSPPISILSFTFETLFYLSSFDYPSGTCFEYIECITKLYKKSIFCRFVHIYLK